MNDKTSAARTRTDSPVQHVDLGLQQREAHVLPSTVNADKRTAEVTWSTGARVKRSSFFDDDFYEELSLNPKHVRMERLNNGAPLLDSHRRLELGNVLGVVERAWIANGEGRARVRFSERTAVADIWKDVQSGVIRNISVGYRVHRFEDATKENTKDNLKVLRAVDWEPMELSAVPVGADAAAQFRSDAGHTNPCVIISREDQSMNTANTTANADTTPMANAPAERIRALTKRVGLTTDYADELIRSGLPEAQARAAIIDHLAELEPAATVNLNLSASSGNANGYDDPQFTRAAAAEAITARYTGAALSERAKPFAYRRIVDHARAALHAAGHHVDMMSDGNVITRALHTTSDFPDLLVSSGQRLLLEGYQSVPSGIKQVALASELRDFRPITVLRLGPFPTLEKVNEHGEIKSGSIAQTKEAYALATYGRIFGISRTALINDDLSAFSDLARRYGAAVANLEAKILADLIISNPVLDDGVTTYHATHGNLGTAAAITVASLGTARQSMRLQKDLDKTTVTNIQPAFLLVSAAKETEAEQIVTSITAGKVADANPFSSLSVAVDPRLDASSATAWYLFASPAVAPVIRYSTLEGNAGPQVETREGFEIPGIEFRVIHDFGAGIVDYRGTFKNPGA